DGLNYYGIQVMNLMLGTGGDVLNVQGTSPGWANSGSVVDDRGVVVTGVPSVTNVTFGAGNNQVFVSSNADVDQMTQAGFDFLTGDLSQLYGSLNIDFAAGRHRLMISDESSTLASTAAITDHVTSLTTKDGLSASAEIDITGMGQGGGGISYRTGPGGNFDDGIEYWFGSATDNIYIDGTEPDNMDGIGGRTTTMLSTGLGDDYVKVDLSVANDTGLNADGVGMHKVDGFFVLNLLGGAYAPGPGGSAPTQLVALTDPATLTPWSTSILPAGWTNNSYVDASTSTLPILVFGNAGSDTIIGGAAQGLDTVIAGNGMPAGNVL